MNSKQLIAIAALVVAAAVALFVINSRGKNSSEDDLKKLGERIVPDFKAEAVTNLSIRDATRTTSFKRVGQDWVIVELGDYPANADKILTLLFAVKDLKVSESRSLRGEPVRRALQLLEPEEGKLDGVGTTISFGAEKEFGKIVIGKNFTTATQNRGKFVKSPDGAIYVAGSKVNSIDTQTDPSAWLDKEFFSVQKIKSVAVKSEKPEDGYTITRAEEDGQLSLVGAKPTDELSPARLGSLGNLFANSRFSDVAVGDDAKPENTGLDKPIEVTVETFEGFKYQVKVGMSPDETSYYLSYEVSAEIPEDEPPSVDPAASPAPRKRTRAELEEKLATEKKFEGKVYRVFSFMVDPVLKKRSELLMTEEEKKAAIAAAEAEANQPGGGLIGSAEDPAVQRAEALKQRRAAEDAAVAKQIADEYRRKKREEEAAENTGDGPRAESGAETESGIAPEADLEPGDETEVESTPQPEVE